SWRTVRCRRSWPSPARGTAELIADGGATAGTVRSACVWVQSSSGSGGRDRPGNALLKRLGGGLGQDDQPLQLPGGALIRALPFGLGGSGIVREREQLLRPVQALALVWREIGGAPAFGFPFGDLEIDGV